MRSLAALLLLLASVAQAQEPAEPDCPENKRPCKEEPASASGPGSLDPGRLHLNPPSRTPEPLTGLHGGGSLGDGKAALLVLVVVAVALPVIVYAVDSPADDVTASRWGEPHVHASLGAGALHPPDAYDFGAAFSGQAAVTWGVWGLDASVESLALAGPPSWAADAHLLIRPPPRAHIDGALALGVRRVVVGQEQRDYFEWALPHAYYPLGRDALFIELRPGVLIAPDDYDLRLDLALAYPLGTHAVLRVRGRAYSFGPHVGYGVDTGLTAWL